ncbi:MAG: thioredoxin family protein [Deltaproteobacteria bacterium]|nr:thioredoxin family protein [Deltaproteobacteria bacterium]
MKMVRLGILAGLAFLAVWLLPEFMPSGPAFDLDIAGQLTGGKLAIGLLFVYLSGIGTSLTPCVYPLIPITLSVMGVKKGGSRLQNAGLGAAYVGGMILTYDAVGVTLIALHKTSGALLSNPFVIVPIALLFVVLAMPMFGVFELNLPAGLQQRLNQVGGPGLLGSFSMGLVAGLVAAPCSGPVTALIAGIVSGTANYALGTLLMTVYAIGIGTLFFVLATFSVQLPRSGPWMEGIKSVFGIALIALAMLYLKDAFPSARAAMANFGHAMAQAALIAAAAVGVGVLFGALNRSFHGDGTEKALKGAGVVLAVLGLFVRFAIPAGAATKPTPPVAGNGTTTGTSEAAHKSEFVSLEVGMKAAHDQHKPMIIDFGAEWCAACKELEAKTYPDPVVQKESARFVMVKVDETDDTDANDALNKKYDVPGLPTVVFLDSNGEPVKDAKLVGYEAPAKFVERMKKVQ